MAVKIIVLLQSACADFVCVVANSIRRPIFFYYFQIL